MSTRLDAHPSDAVLQGFALGKLSDNSAGKLIDHLDACPECRKRAAELPDATLNVRANATLDPGAAQAQPFAAPPPKTPPAAAAPGTLQGVPADLADHPGYEIVRELGRGGMGVVYLARNVLMDRLEVLKVMNQATVGKPDAIERFIQEIRSAARLNHPNVATAYSAHLIGEQIVLAMEYIEGDDLGKILKARGALPIPFAAFCVREAALGLQRGHELGLVHRDIKPSNLILTRHGKRSFVKIVDFGLAKAKAETPTERGLTASNQLMGTVGFTAPEQLRDARSADTRADIYSLGCTLYSLLSGNSPFPGNSAYEVFLAQEAGEVRPLRQVRPDIPEGLATIVDKMMAKDATQRYRQPGEVAEALLPFMKQDAKTSAVAETLAPTPGRRDAIQKNPPAVQEPALDLTLPVRRKPVQDPPDALRETSSTEQRTDARVTRTRDRVERSTQIRRRPRRRRKAGPWIAALLVGVLVGLGAAVAGIFWLMHERPTSGQIVVENLPADAEVQIDNQTVILTRENLRATASGVAAGAHKIKALQRGREFWSTDVTVTPGTDPVRVRVELPPPVVPVPPLEPLKQKKEPAGVTSPPPTKAAARPGPPEPDRERDPPPPGPDGFRPPPPRPDGSRPPPPGPQGQRPPPPDPRGPRPPPPRPPGPGPGPGQPGPGA
jgi:serine/threonine protein kinase